MHTSRAGLWEAYLHTTYTAHCSRGEIRIRPGYRTPMLDRLLDEEGIRDWAYVTAYNPGSVELASDENVRRQQELVEAVQRRGLTLLHGDGTGDDSRWSPEPSVLILAIGAGDARALGRQFGQLAIVVGRTGEPARVVWCSDTVYADTVGTEDTMSTKEMRDTEGTEN